MSGTIDRRGFLAGAVVGMGLGRRPRIGEIPPILPPQRLSQAIRGPVIERGAPGFASAAHVYNQRFDHVLPQAVARPLNAEDVVAAVRWGVGQGVRLRPRSGGHSYAGYSTLVDGVVLDLRNLRSISVNRHAGTATVGAGAQLIDVYTALAAHGATIPAGSCPSVGVCGVTLGGGMGLAGRAFGLTTDHLIGARIVTADGRLRTVNAKSEPYLLWALQGGGGGNFGIVTEFTFRLEPLPPVAASFHVSWPWASAGEALDAWLGWAPHADPRLTSIFHLEASAGAPHVKVAGQFLGTSSAAEELLAPLRAVPGTYIYVGEDQYLPLQMSWAGCAADSLAACHTVGTAPGGALPRASFNAKSDYLKRTLPTPALNLLADAIEVRARQPGSGAILFDSYGGAINRVAPDATAFIHRDTLCAMQYLTYGGGAEWLQGTWSGMRPYASGEAYQNYIDAALPNWREAYYGDNYPHLSAIRSLVDPDRYFKFGQGV